MKVHNEASTGPQCVGCKLPEMPIAAAGFHENAPAPSTATHPLTSLPQLSSRPESNNILLLDFDGHTYTGNRWTNAVNPDDPIVTPVFTLDNDYQTFSDSELQAIQEIWARVSEDFAPWDVNVTTVDPGTTRMSQKKAQRCCIGGSNSDWYGSGAGGVAYINAFNWEQDEICFAFAGAFWGNTHNIAAVTSHELGHTLNLRHQSLWVNSNKEEEYRPGTGQGILRHGAIMGNSYGTYSDTWYDGLTPSQNSQADLSVISNSLAYVADDHGDTTSEATVLENIHQQSISGLIHSAQDVDIFAVTLAQGTFLAKAIPAEIGPNLDLKIELLNEQGQQVVLSNPATTLSASIETTVSDGTYFLSVSSSGAYGKIGTYNLSMTQPGVVLDHYTIDENESAGATVGHLTLTNSATDIGGNISRVKSIAAGYRHSLFLKKDAGLWAVGSNQNGGLGNGTKTQQNSPIHVLDTNVAAVAAGTYHSMILRQDGSVWTVGNDFYGELGNNPLISLQTYPVRACPSGAVDISTQAFHGLILKADGSVLGMGRNDEGQLGDGTTTNQPSATPIFQSGIRSISAGGYHSLFLKTDGTLWATGRNTNGQLGDDSTVSKSTPVQLDTEVATIEAGEFHSLYLKEDGSLWATGKNSNGQLGDGTTASKQVPVQITGIQGTVVALAAGGDHTLVLTSDGGLWGMGRNDYGQLGNGSTTDVSTPNSSFKPESWISRREATTVSFC